MKSNHFRWEYDEHNYEHNLFLGKLVVGYVQTAVYDVDDSKEQVFGQCMLPGDADNGRYYTRFSSAKRGVERKLFKHLDLMGLSLFQADGIILGPEDFKKLKS